MTPSAAFAAWNALSGNVVPCAVRGFSPTSISSNANSICQSFAAARSTPSVAVVISGPMPSPCMTQKRIGAAFGRGMIAVSSYPSPEMGGSTRNARRGGVISRYVAKNPPDRYAPSRCFASAFVENGDRRSPMLPLAGRERVSIPGIRLRDERIGVCLVEIDFRTRNAGIERLEHLVGGLGGFLGKAAVGRIGVVVRGDRLHEHGLVAQRVFLRH